MNNKSDLQIKDLLNSTGRENGIEVSDQFHKCIQDTLDSLPDKRPGKKLAFTAIAAAALVMVSVTAVYGKDIPLINSVIEFFKGAPAISNSSDASAYGKYAAVIGKTVKNNGISITIDSVACDEDNLVLFYTAEGKSDEITEVPGIIRYGKGVLGKFYVNGKRVLPRYNRKTAYLTEDGKIKGMCGADISKEKLPDEFELKFDAFTAMSKEGKWSFAFNVSKAQAMKETKVFRPNKDFTVKFKKSKSNPGEEHNISIKRVSFTPFGNSITISEKFTKKVSIDKLNAFSYFALYDDKGNVLDYSFPSGFTTSESGAENTFDFVKGSKDMKFLKLVPVDPHFDRIDNSIKDPVGAITSLPLELKVSEKGAVIIEKVEFAAKETRIYYKRKGFIANWGNSGSDFFLLDEKGRDAFNNTDPLQYDYVYDRDKGIYVNVLPPLDKNTKYKIGCHKDGSYDYYEDQAVTIPLP